MDKLCRFCGKPADFFCQWANCHICIGCLYESEALEKVYQRSREGFYDIKQTNEKKEGQDGVGSGLLKNERQSTF